MKKILVTGATGFLGKYVVQELIEKGYKVLALGRNENEGKKLEKIGAIFCKGDFVEKDKCSSYFQGVDYVVHAGALSTVWGKWESFYSEYIENRCDSTLFTYLAKNLTAKMNNLRGSLYGMSDKCG